MERGNYISGIVGAKNTNIQEVVTKLKAEGIVPTPKQQPTQEKRVTKTIKRKENLEKQCLTTQRTIETYAMRLKRLKQGTHPRKGKTLVKRLRKENAQCTVTSRKIESSTSSKKTIKSSMTDFKCQNIENSL